MKVAITDEREKKFLPNRQLRFHRLYPRCEACHHRPAKYAVDDFPVHGARSYLCAGCLNFYKIEI